MTSRKLANRALWVTLGAAIIAWLLYLAGKLGDIAVEVGRIPADFIWQFDGSAASLVYPSVYVTFAAIATVTIGGLFGRRFAARGESIPAVSNLARPVRVFATTIVIVGLALAAFTPVSIFFENLMRTSDNPGERLLSTYVPIILYTALIVGVVLIGFVFTRATHPAEEPAQPGPDPLQATAEPAASDQASPSWAIPDQAQRSGSDSGAQRATAVAYVAPIIAIAVSLLAGLIVYDLTRQPIEGWVWVVVCAVAATGIILGTIFAARASKAAATSAGVGAKNLNFLLSIVFTVAVSIMSIAFGVQAVNSLKMMPSMSLYVTEFYSSESDEVEARERDSLQVDAQDAKIEAYGWGFARGTDVEIRYENETLIAGKVESMGDFWLSSELGPEVTGIELSPGTHEFSAHATTLDGAGHTLSVTLTVNDDGEIDLEKGQFAELAPQPIQLAAPTASWVLLDFGSALLMLLIVVAVLQLTITARNRDTNTV